MRILSGFCVAVLCCFGLSAQVRSGFSPRAFTGVPNAVFPPVKPIINAGVQRNINTGFFGKAFGFNNRGFGNGFNGGVVPYAYPVYVGGFGYGYGGSFDSPYASGYVPGDTSQQQAPPNVTVVYPPQPAPVIINQFGPGGAAQPPAAAAAPVTENATPADSGEQTAPTRYLIAFKDHTVYSAIAYWVDGDTLHYFTSGNTHNQASLSLVDRELTDRLNKESGVQFNLPPVKAAQ
jgi:hypothetical protein